MDLSHPIASLIPGSTGRILETLARVGADMNLSTVARVAGVSTAQASRILPRLVKLGLVTRWDTPPSSQFRINHENIAARKLQELMNMGEEVADVVQHLARSICPQPANVTLFGSAARGTASASSDIDLLLVRPSGVDDDDRHWTTSATDWELGVHRAVGNRVNVIEVGEDELSNLLRSGGSVWRAIVEEGRPLLGISIDLLAERA